MRVCDLMSLIVTTMNSFSFGGKKLILMITFVKLHLAGSGSSSSAGSAWSKKPMLMSSTVTQVFHIPVEERKDQLAGDFGAGTMDGSHKSIKYGNYTHYIQ